MKLIACVDNNWAIGYNGELLYRIPEDLKNFKRITEDNIVIMGKNTYKSIGKFLPNRTNVILSSSMKEIDDNPDHIIIKNFGDLMQYLMTDNRMDHTYVIGGSSIYNQLYPYCTEAIITKVYASAENADSYCPNLAKLGWKCIESDQREYKDLQFSFKTFINPDPILN